MHIFLWLLLIYFIATTISFVIGIGPTPGNPRKWYWWERILTFPLWSLSIIAQTVPFLGIPVILIIQLYIWIFCYPLSLLYEQIEVWKHNRENKK